MTLTVSGAYSRDYKNKKSILEDWLAGKDFVLRSVESRGNINRQDAEAQHVDGINVRYNNDRNIALIIRQKDGSWTIK